MDSRAYTWRHSRDVLCVKGRNKFNLANCLRATIELGKRSELYIGFPKHLPSTPHSLPIGPHTNLSIWEGFDSHLSAFLIWCTVAMNSMLYNNVLYTIYLFFLLIYRLIGVKYYMNLVRIVHETYGIRLKFKMRNGNSSQPQRAMGAGKNPEKPRENLRQSPGPRIIPRWRLKGRPTREGPEEIFRICIPFLFFATSRFPDVSQLFRKISIKLLKNNGKNQPNNWSTNLQMTVRGFSQFLQLVWCWIFWIAHERKFFREKLLNLSKWRDCIVTL